MSVSCLPVYLSVCLLFSFSVFLLCLISWWTKLNEASCTFDCNSVGKTVLEGNVRLMEMSRNEVFVGNFFSGIPRRGSKCSGELSAGRMSGFPRRTTSLYVQRLWFVTF